MFVQSLLMRRLDVVRAIVGLELALLDLQIVIPIMSTGVKSTR